MGTWSEGNSEGDFQNFGISKLRENRTQAVGKNWTEAARKNRTATAEKNRKEEKPRALDVYARKACLQNGSRSGREKVRPRRRNRPPKIVGREKCTRDSRTALIRTQSDR